MGLLQRLTGDDGVAHTGHWPDRREDLLEPGETVEAEVPLGADAAIVLTGRRVLAFSPTLSGPNFAAIDRPNVDGVRLGATATRSHLSNAGAMGVLGVVLLGAGFLIDLDALVGDVDLSAGAAEQIGVGGFVGFMQSVLDLLALLDEAFIVGGALAAIGGVALVVVYLQGRTPTIVLEVAGGDDVHVPRPEEPREAVSRVETVLGHRPPSDVGESVPAQSEGGREA